MGKRLAKKIIENNIYLTLSTTDGKMPWASPVRYLTDESLNFYFISSEESLHARNIANNPNVSFAIFDSRQPDGTGEGIQASGTCSIAESYPDEIAKYFGEMDLRGKIFKISSVRFWLPDEEAWEKYKVDKRTEVEIE